MAQGEEREEQSIFLFVLFIMAVVLAFFFVIFLVLSDRDFLFAFLRIAITGLEISAVLSHGLRDRLRRAAESFYLDSVTGAHCGLLIIDLQRIKLDLNCKILGEHLVRLITHSLVNFMFLHVQPLRHIMTMEPEMQQQFLLLARTIESDLG